MSVCLAIDRTSREVIECHFGLLDPLRQHCTRRMFCYRRLVDTVHAILYVDRNMYAVVRMDAYVFNACPGDGGQKVLLLVFLLLLLCVQ